MNYKFCPHCGQKIDADATFCPHCGAEQSSQMNQEANQQPNFQEPQQPQPNFQQQNYQQPPNQPRYNGGGYSYNQNPGYRQKVQITPPPCSMKDAWLSFWHQYGKGHGYSSRSEFWLMYVNNMIVIIALFILMGVFYAITPAMAAIPIIAMCAYGIAIIVPSVAIECRRLRDAGVSNGWVTALVILNFIPYLNFFSGIATFVFTVMPSVRYQ